MFEPSLEKIFYIVIGAIAGVFLKWCLDIYIEKLKWSNYNDAILEELHDVKDRLHLICMSYERNLKMFTLNGLSNEIPLKVSNPLFKKHYTEIAIKLRASQRKSFSLIDAYIDGINSQIQSLSELRNSIPNRPKAKDFKEWGDMLKVGYCNAATTYWHVNYHLVNKDFPFLEVDSEEHKAYQNQLNSSKEYLENLIETARASLTIDSFS